MHQRKALLRRGLFAFCLTCAVLSVTLSGMTIECSQCAERIGGHDPKCMADGRWWCEKCVYWFERESERQATTRELLDDLDAFEQMLKRRAALASGEDA